MKRVLKMGDLILGIVFLVLCIFIYAISGNFPSFGEAHLSAGTFPRMIVVLLGLLSIMLIIASARKILQDKAVGRFAAGNLSAHIQEHKLVYWMFMVFFFYILSMQYLGFRIATFAFIFGSSCMLSPRSKKDIVIAGLLALVITFGSYYFFQNVLNVRFPRGLW